MTQERYVIVNTKSIIGNSVVFWCYDSSGYTADLRMAGIYTFDEANAICKNGTKEKMFKYSDVLKLVQHHVDCQDLYKEDIPKYAHTFSHLNVRK